jgi:hypothetical protein
VTGKVVQHNNVTWLERWEKLLLDQGGEAGGVDLLVEDEWRIDPVTSKCCDESRRFPVTIRQPSTPRARLNRLCCIVNVNRCFLPVRMRGGACDSERPHQVPMVTWA